MPPRIFCREGGRLTVLNLVQCEKVCAWRVPTTVLEMSTFAILMSSMPYIHGISQGNTLAQRVKALRNPCVVRASGPALAQGRDFQTH